MASTNNPGDWVQGSEKFLKADAKKATSGGSAISRGAVVILNAGTGVWAKAAATLNLTGRKGICTHTNLDADPTFTIMTGGGIVYGVADGAIKPGDAVSTSDGTAGRVKAHTAPAAAPDNNRIIVGYYEGHADEGDGSADHPATDAAQGDTIKIRLVDNS